MIAKGNRLFAEGVRARGRRWAATFCRKCLGGAWLSRWSGGTTDAASQCSMCSRQGQRPAPRRELVSLEHRLPVRYKAMAAAAVAWSNGSIWTKNGSTPILVQLPYGPLTLTNSAIIRRDSIRTRDVDSFIIIKCGERAWLEWVSQRIMRS